MNAFCPLISYFLLRACWCFDAPPVGLNAHDHFRCCAVVVQVARVALAAHPVEWESHQAVVVESWEAS